MKNKLMKLVVIAENMFCVYRNYYSFSFAARFIIWAKILIEFALIAICIPTYFMYFQKYQWQLTYLFLTLSSSFCIVLLAWYHCKAFGCFIKIIEKTHGYFINDKQYAENLDKKFKIVLFVIIAYPFLSVVLLIYFYIMYRNLIDEYRFFIYGINMFSCNIRYIYEYIVLYCILFVLSEHINCITRKITTERLVDLVANEQNSRTSNVVGEITSFEEWTAVYSSIKKCSHLINTIFGVEITIILTAVIFFLIIFFYAIAYTAINGPVTSFDFLTYIVKLIIFLVALYVLSQSAQVVQNNVVNLKRCLGRLLIYSTEDVVCYKETKDFLRLVSSRPIRTQAFGSINVDMALLPKLIMFFTSYTVIALQFNNVV